MTKKFINLLVHMSVIHIVDVIFIGSTNSENWSGSNQIRKFESF